MSDTSQGEGWWYASDGKWYPPQANRPAEARDDNSSPSGRAETTPQPEQTGTAERGGCGGELVKVAKAFLIVIAWGLS